MQKLLKNDLIQIILLCSFCAILFIAYPKITGEKFKGLFGQDNSVIEAKSYESDIVVADGDNSLDISKTQSGITSVSELTEFGRVSNTITYSNQDQYTHIYGIKANPIITTDQIVDYGLRKGNELISILQTLAQPLCIIFFIIGCGCVLAGSITSTSVMLKGVMGMTTSSVIYAMILYSPLLVNTVVSYFSA